MLVSTLKYIYGCCMELLLWYPMPVFLSVSVSLHLTCCLRDFPESQFPDDVLAANLALPDDDFPIGFVSQRSAAYRPQTFFF